MLFIVNATDPTELWSPDDLREAGDGIEAETVTEDHIGIRFCLDGTDSVLLFGTEAQVIERLETTLAVIRRERAILDGTDPVPAPPAAVSGPGCRRIVADEV